MSSKLDIQLSKRKLFFPLPLSNSTVEDVIEVKNALPKINDNARENIVSFKAFSVVRGKYSMNPSTGFIGAGESVVLKFSLETEYISKCQDPNTQFSPTEESHDIIYLFFAVVPVSMLSTCLGRWDPIKPIQNTSEIQRAARTFWKNRGGSGPLVPSVLSDDTITRKRLKCIFKPQESIPVNIPIHLNSKDNVDTPVNAGRPNESNSKTQNNSSDYLTATHKSKVSHTNDPKTTPLGEAHVPSCFNVTKRSTGTTTSLMRHNPHDDLKEGFDNRTTYNNTSGSDRYWELSTVMRAINNFYDPSKVTGVLLSPLRTFLRSVLDYRIPYRFVVAILVLSFLFGLFERMPIVVEEDIGSNIKLKPRIPIGFGKEI